MQQGQCTVQGNTEAGIGDAVFDSVFNKLTVTKEAEMTTDALRTMEALVCK
jgi:hypothetical protein